MLSFLIHKNSNSVRVKAESDIEFLGQYTYLVIVDRKE